MHFVAYLFLVVLLVFDGLVVFLAFVAFIGRKLFCFAFVAFFIRASSATGPAQKDLDDDISAAVALQEEQSTDDELALEANEEQRTAQDAAQD